MWLLRKKIKSYALSVKESIHLLGGSIYCLEGYPKDLDHKLFKKTKHEIRGKFLTWVRNKKDEMGSM